MAWGVTWGRWLDGLRGCAKPPELVYFDGPEGAGARPLGELAADDPPPPGTTCRAKTAAGEVTYSQRPARVEDEPSVGALRVIEKMVLAERNAHLPMHSALMAANATLTGRNLELADQLAAAKIAIAARDAAIEEARAKAAAEERYGARDMRIIQAVETLGGKIADTLDVKRQLKDLVKRLSPATLNGLVKDLGAVTVTELLQLTEGDSEDDDGDEKEKRA